MGVAGRDGAGVSCTSVGNLVFTNCGLVGVANRVGVRAWASCVSGRKLVLTNCGPVGVASGVGVEVSCLWEAAGGSWC